MKKILSVLILVLALLFQADAQTPPWNEKGNFTTSLTPLGKYVWNPMDPMYWYDYYSSKYDQMPMVIIYDDLMDVDSLGLFVGYYYKPYSVFEAAPEDSTWWQESFTWGELRPHLEAVLENTVTHSQQILPLPNYNLNTQLAYGDTGSYRAVFKIDMTNLPLNDQNVLYRLWVAPTTEPLPEYLRVDTLSVVRTTRSVPADTIFWMYRNWYDSIESDPNLPARMLAYYPDDTRLLRHQFWTYYQAANCDSVTYYGNRLIQVWEEEKSTYMGDFLDTFHQQDAKEDILERIHDICVDGTPKPIKKLGGSQY